MSKTYDDPQPYYQVPKPPQTLSFDLKTFTDCTVLTLDRPPNTDVVISDNQITITMKKG